MKGEQMTKLDVQEPRTATRILDVAERLVQVRGFNGFSYANIAAELQITKAALHYHFASKAELGKALIERYSTRFAEALVDVEAQYTEAPLRLRGFAGLYIDVLKERRMCLCGMMAAEYETLPPSMQSAVVRYIRENQSWLSDVLKRGKEQGSLAFEGSPDEVASMIFGALEGAMLMARPLDDVSGFESSANRLLTGLRPVS
ncbi:MAG: TetR/AcrR family transcriptional regulator [Acidimicrobiales bacterium]|jgi:TetR/AcrR family transcriptional repressor of nem operon